MSNNPQEHPQQELLKEQTTAGENLDNSTYYKPEIEKKTETYNTELLHQEEVPNTPFHIISIENKEHFLTIGKYRISNKFNTKEEALNVLENQPWEIVFNLISTMIGVEKEK